MYRLPIQKVSQTKRLEVRIEKLVKQRNHQTKEMLKRKKEKERNDESINSSILCQNKE